MAQTKNKTYSQAGRLQDLIRTLMARKGGITIDEIVEWFDVTPEQVKAVIEFAARSLEAPVSGR